LLVVGDLKLFSGSGNKSRLKKLRRCALWFTVVLLAWWGCAWLLARLLIVVSPVDHPDAIIMLSGSSAYVERSRFAAALYRDGIAPRIILTNDGEQGSWSNVEQRNPFYVERAQNQLRREGVPTSSMIVLPQTVSSTHEEAQALRDYVDQQGLNAVLIVTSSYHSRRALSSFRRVFASSNCRLGIQPVPVSLERFGPGTWWLHLRGWNAVPKEYFKLIYYWLWSR